MSRVGKYPVTVPSGVTVEIANRILKAKGKLGELSLRLSDEVDAKLEGGKVVVTPRSETKRARTLWGTTRAHVNNMVGGVSKGIPHLWPDKATRRTNPPLVLQRRRAPYPSLCNIGDSDRAVVRGRPCTGHT